MPFATKHSSHLVGAIVFAFIMVCSGNAAQTAEMTPANIRLTLLSAVNTRPGMWRWKKVSTPSAA